MICEFKTTHTKMKKMKIYLLLFMLVTGSFLFQTAAAQVHADVNINIGAQPVWGPVGYDHVEYYYLPDIDAYYNVPRHQYVYMREGNWVFSSHLPSQYHDYDMDRAYKVVINDPTPYRHNTQYRSDYAKYKGNHSQEIIRNSHDSRYYQIKEHPEHENWKKEQHDQHDHH
jgi:hypothetical protein